MENSTSGGTPLATQNAPVQSMPRSRPALFAVGSSPRLASTADVHVGPLRMIRNGCAAPRRFQRCLPTIPYLATPKIDAPASSSRQRWWRRASCRQGAGWRPTRPWRCRACRRSPSCRTGPTWRLFGSQPASAMGREHPSVAPTASASSLNCATLASSPMPRPMVRMNSAAVMSTSSLEASSTNSRPLRAARHRRARRTR